MKILIYSSAFYSDSTLPIYKAMKEKGQDVTLLYELTRPKSNLFEEQELDPRHCIFKASEYRSFQRYEKYCDLSDIYVENCPNTHQQSFKSLKSTLRVLEFIKQGNYDVIHTDIVMMLWKMLLLKYRKKMIWAIHEPIPHARKEHFIYRISRVLNLNIIPKLVIFNHAIADEFCRHYKIDSKRLLINSLGNLDCITVFSDNSKVNKKQLLFWGRISRYKGLEYLCQAMEIVCKEVPDAQLLIAGGGDLYFDITPYLSLPNIILMNRYFDMEELAHLISGSAFTVCPYLSSSQSGSVITSLVMGKPVIGTDIESMHEMIENGVTGLLVPPCDAQALSNAIIKFLKDEQMLDKLTSNICKINEKNKPYLEIADKYICFYQKII